MAKLYRAYKRNDEQAIRALILPQIINCGLISPAASDALAGGEEPREIIAWKIQSIRFDLHNYDQVDEECPGQPVHATSGALVFIKQTDREQGKEPATGDIVEPWLYVDGTWYWLIDVD